MTEALIEAGILSTTLIGTGAILYGRLVRIETIVKRQDDAIAKLFGRSKKDVQARIRIDQLDSRVKALEARA